LNAQPQEIGFGDYAALSVSAGFVPALTALMAEVCGDGPRTQDSKHVSNVVRANLFAGEAPAAPGSVLNIGCGQRSSVLDLIEAIGEATGKSLDPGFVAPRLGDFRHSFANIDRVRAQLGCKPETRFADGIDKTYRALLEVQSAARLGLPAPPAVT
jgi:nucleoside-diphosphate-sugar epimerase